MRMFLHLKSPVKLGEKQRKERDTVKDSTFQMKVNHGFTYLNGKLKEQFPSCSTSELVLLA
jgi:hypothetical protein